MRILGGTLKGRTLAAHVATGTRPTTDAMRESLFATLEAYIDWTDCVVLDCFSGTGALGFEALSRGAAHCTFIDSNSSMCRALHQNASALGCADRCTILNDDVLRVLALHQGRFDAVFCDPPYDLRTCNQVLRELHNRKSVTSDGLFIAEHDEREVVVAIEGWERRTARKRGGTVIDIVQFTSTP